MIEMIISNSLKYTEAWLVRNAIIACIISLTGLAVMLVLRQGTGGLILYASNIIMILCFLLMIKFVPRKALALSFLCFLIIGKILFARFWDDNLLTIQSRSLLPLDDSSGMLVMLLIAAIPVTSTLIHALENHTYPYYLQRIVAVTLLMLTISLLFTPGEGIRYSDMSKTWKDTWAIPTFTIATIFYAIAALLHTYRKIPYKLVSICSAILLCIVIAALAYEYAVVRKISSAYQVLYLIPAVGLPVSFIILIRCSTVTTCIQYTSPHCEESKP